MKRWFIGILCIIALCSCKKDVTVPIVDMTDTYTHTMNSSIVVGGKTLVQFSDSVAFVPLESYIKDKCSLTCDSVYQIQFVPTANNRGRYWATFYCSSYTFSSFYREPFTIDVVTPEVPSMQFGLDNIKYMVSASGCEVRIHGWIMWRPIDYTESNVYFRFYEEAGLHGETNVGFVMDADIFRLTTNASF